MLRLITGRIGSGKTTRIYNEIKSRVSAGESVMLIVPEQYSFFTEKMILKLLGANGADSVEVVSFSFLARNLLKKYGLNDKKLLDDSGRALMMSLALENLSDELKVYGRHRYSPSVISEMLKIIKDFRQNAVSPDLVQSTATRIEMSVLKNKLHEIAKIYQAYSSLVEQSYFDDECALDLLCDVLDEHKDLQGKTVFIDGFRGFTLQEYKVLERIMIQSTDTYITVCVDNLTDTDDKFSAFAHTKKTKRKLVRTAEKAGVRVAKPEYIEMNADRLRDAELEALEKNLYNDCFEVYEGETKSIILCSAESFISECEYVAHTVKKLIRTENLRCRDIAIISRNDDGYSRQIRSALKKNDVPVFDDCRYPILSQPLVEFVLSAVDIAKNGFSIDAVMRVAKTGLTDLKTEEISELENYAVMWQINGKKWLENWTGHPEGLGEKMLEKDIDKLENINRIRKKIVEPLQKFKNKLKDFSGLSSSEAIYSLLIEMNVPKNLKSLAVCLNKNGQKALALEQNRIWELVIEILDRMAFALEKTKLTASRLYDLLNLIVSSYTIGNIPQGLDEITIGTADRVKTTSPKVVFVVGLNDGVFPRIPVSGRILTENDRKKLTEFDLHTDDSFEEKMTEEHFIAYNTLCSASEKLYLSYARKTADGSENGCSEIVTQICGIFPNITIEDTVDTELVDYIEGKAPAFELMAKLTQNGGIMYETLKKYFSDCPEWKDRLSALGRVTHKGEFAITDKELAKRLFGADMYMSASRIEVYHKCPFEYFCKYGLNAQPRKKAELDPMKEGTAVHFILEKLISKYGSDGLCKMEKSERDEVIGQMLDDYFKEILVSGENLGERFEYLFRQLGVTVCEVVDRLVAEFGVSEFVPVAFELKIDNDGEVDTYTINLSDGGTLSIKGSVDRVDVAKIGGENYVRVVDYKSSGKNFDLNEVYYGLNMQMLIYLFAIWKSGFREYKNVKPAGVLYMPVNAPFAYVNRGTQQEVIDKEKRKQAKMEGMVLDDSRVVYSMDNRKQAEIIPASIKDDGTCSGNVFSLKQMSLLMKKVEKILDEMAVKLHNGAIPVMPAKSQKNSSPYTDVCKFCDYKTVCLVDEDTPIRSIESMNFSESLKKLGGESDA